MSSSAVELAAEWGLPPPSETSALATNNLVWRCGDAWLKASSSGRAAREVAIGVVDKLGEIAALSVPKYLRTHSGNSVIERRGYCWTAETALQGGHPNINREADYFEAWTAIDVLHGALRSVDTHFISRSIVSELRDRLRSSAPTQSSRCAIFGSVAEILSAELGWIEGWPVQVIHGDLSHPNILLSAGVAPGFIDFEFLSRDPVEFDFATLVTTLFVRSDFDGSTKKSVLSDIVRAHSVDQCRLFTATLARRWLAAAANLTHPLGTNAEVLARQFSHLCEIAPLAERALSKRV